MHITRWLVYIHNGVQNIQGVSRLLVMWNLLLIFHRVVIKTSDFQIDAADDNLAFTPFSRRCPMQSVTKTYPLSTATSGRAAESEVPRFELRLRVEILLVQFRLYFKEQQDYSLCPDQYLYLIINLYPKTFLFSSACSFWDLAWHTLTALLPSLQQ